MSDSLTIAAPFSGTAVAISHVPDPVFAQEIVGPGVALEPETPDEVVTVSAPVTGTITALFPHAFSLSVVDGVDVLVHLGIDTVSLKGEGFTVHTQVGDYVEVGQPLIEWDMGPALAAGLSTKCPIVAVQGEPSDFDVLVHDGDGVHAGQTVASWNYLGTD